MLLQIEHFGRLSHLSNAPRKEELGNLTQQKILHPLAFCFSGFTFMCFCSAVVFVGFMVVAEFLFVEGLLCRVNVLVPCHILVIKILNF